MKRVYSFFSISCWWCIIPCLLWYAQNEAISIGWIVSSLLYTAPLCLLLILVPSRKLYYILSAFILVFTIMELTMVVKYNSFMSAGNILAVFTTTAKEGGDFLKNSMTVLPYALITILMWAVGVYARRNYVYKRNVFVWIMFFITIIICVLFIIIRAPKTKQTRAFYIHQNILGRPPYNFFYQLYNISNQMFIKRSIRESEKMSYGSVREKYDGKEIYVLVIGESCRYSNMQLAGYNRKTNPLLSTIENITLYSNYYSTATLTMYSVPQILTRATPSNYDINYKEKAIFQPFKECGFKTYTICCHNLLTYERYLSDGCDGLYCVSNDIDIPHVIDSLSALNDKTFFVAQMFGSHGSYRNFEKEQDVFHPNPESDNVPWSDYNAMVNAYDNTILYTDSVLFSIIEKINGPNVQSAMIFVSDHGEDFTPGSGGHGGNCQPRKWEYHVPFIFWHSNLWGGNHAKKKTNMLTHKDMPINADNVFYTVCDMADINIKSDYAKPEWSVLCDSFKLHSRYLIVPDGKNRIKLR